MICLGDIKKKKSHGNWKSVETYLKTMNTLFTLHVSLSLVSLFILQSVFFQY